MSESFLNADKPGSGKRVLLIDDEEMILAMMCDHLMQYGYEVKVTTDGEEALQAFAETNFDLTVCDWRMPGLNGRQFYERLRDVNPKACERMIFVSGDVINAKMRQFLEKEKCASLSKPFTLSEFRSVIEATLKP